MSFSYDAYGKFYKFKFSIDIVVIVIYLLVESFTYFIRYVTVNSCYHSSQVFWVLYKNCSCSYDMLRDGPSSECSLSVGLTLCYRCVHSVRALLLFCWSFSVHTYPYIFIHPEWASTRTYHTIHTHTSLTQQIVFGVYGATARKRIYINNSLRKLINI